jgi:hypothetical protein
LASAAAPSSPMRLPYKSSFTSRSPPAALTAVSAAASAPCAAGVGREGGRAVRVGGGAGEGGAK